MNAIFSVQRFLLALALLVVAWAPAATIARPGAQRAAFAAEATAQGQPEVTQERTGTTARTDSVAKHII